MKNNIIIIIIALICLIIGFILGYKTHDSHSTNSLIGTYECTDWNGGSGGISILNEEELIIIGSRHKYSITNNRKNYRN